ncbi:thioredoxin-dependent thiol peroxidase [Thermogemmatispora tikiterensis]|uniref:thioredoxin-dependent peroxiredoxin n=1 Tax=Thermogemmatispora tikiterensis TaxID=1825093 RepID=A0A328VCB6_9CHLR|nr:thioredoxin-dependent thiol peroxidase [Thermogemmatispora tikiterensis]RAQ94421.1 alkyl hydroperoxide reductase [Thermogemmatispora tikiterensis]
MSETIERVVLEEGQPAPDFALPVVGGDETSGDQLHLADLRGRVVVLYFYPKDNTPGCTTEACNFRDMHPEFRRRGIAVLGISADEVDSHRDFAEKYHLPFPLLADVGAVVARQYGAYGEKTLYGRKYLGVQRMTFLLDRDGVIRKIWRSVKPDGHAQEVLRAIEELQLA